MAEITITFSDNEDGSVQLKLHPPIDESEELMSNAQALALSTFQELSMDDFTLGRVAGRG